MEAAVVAEHRQKLLETGRIAQTELGITLIRGGSGLSIDKRAEHFVASGKCCILEAVVDQMDVPASLESSEDDLDVSSLAARRMDVPQDFTLGIMDGWDGLSQWSVERERNADYRAGYEVGEELALELMGSVP